MIRTRCCGLVGAMIPSPPVISPRALPRNLRQAAQHAPSEGRGGDPFASPARLQGPPIEQQRGRQRQRAALMLEEEQWGPKARVGSRSARSRPRRASRRSGNPGRTRRQHPGRSLFSALCSWPKMQKRRRGYLDSSRTWSSIASAFSSVEPTANVNSEIRISRAFASIRFSAPDKPFPISLRERFRTTSATW